MITMRNEYGQSSMEFVMMLTLAMIVVMLAAILVNAKFIQSANLISEEVQNATKNISEIKANAGLVAGYAVGPQGLILYPIPA